MSISNLFENNDFVLKSKAIDCTDVSLSRLIDSNQQLGIDGQVLATDGEIALWKSLDTLQSIKYIYFSTGASSLVQDNFIGQGQVNSNFNNVALVIPRNSVIKSIAVLANSELGIGQNYEFILFVNGVNQGTAIVIGSTSNFNITPNLFLNIQQGSLIAFQSKLLGPGVPNSTANICIELF
jgi:hypothetical protein